MAYEQIPGVSAYLPPPQAYYGAVSFSSGLVIDATGEKIAFIGTVHTPNRGTKSIRKIGFRFGAVTKAGGSALTVSLQDVSTSSNFQPDGTQDQTVAIANADASFVSNTWYLTGNLSADRSVAYGELIAVVIEYDGAGRLGADSVVVNSVTAELSNLNSCPSFNTGSWAAQSSSLNNVLLEFSDGTFGTLLPGVLASAISSNAFKQDTAGSDEYGIEFSFPFNCKIDGMWAYMAATANTSDFSVIVYDGTTALETVAIDANTLTGYGAARLFERPFSQEITCTANTTYRIALQPTQTTNTITLYYFDVAVAGHLNALHGGTAMCECKRINTGAWTTTTTRRPLMGVRISSIDTGSGGGGTRAYAFAG